MTILIIDKTSTGMLAQTRGDRDFPFEPTAVGIGTICLMLTAVAIVQWSRAAQQA